MRIFKKPQYDYYSINMLLSAVDPVLLSMTKMTKVKQLQINSCNLIVNIEVHKT